VCCKISPIADGVGRFFENGANDHGRSRFAMEDRRSGDGRGVAVGERIEQRTAFRLRSLHFARSWKIAGSLVVLRGSREVKGRIDAGPGPTSALPLMRRIKEQFDLIGFSRRADLSEGSKRPKWSRSTSTCDPVILCISVSASGRLCGYLAAAGRASRKSRGGARNFMRKVKPQDFERKQEMRWSQSSSDPEGNPTTPMSASV